MCADALLSLFSYLRSCECGKTEDGEEFFVKDDLAIASRCELFCIFGNLAITCALYKAKVIK